MRLKKKLLKISIGIFSTFLILVFVIPVVPIPISIETTALEIIFDDASHAEKRNVKIRGWYNYSLLGGWHWFRGTIEVQEYPETNSAFMYSPLRLSPAHGERGGLWGTRSELLFYLGEQELVTLSGTNVKGYNPTVFGEIYTTPFFEQSMIAVRNDDDLLSLFHSPIIILNTTTREQAFEILLSLAPTEMC